MLVIGLVGGIGSGKSLVADLFRQLGAEVIQADQIGHEVLRLPEVVKILQERWGDAILRTDGTIDRSRVARIVFDPSDKAGRELEFLESVTHPRIEERILRGLERLAGQADVRAAVLDAAILLEAGWGNRCDKIVFVDAEREQRLQRVCGRGWTAENFAAREAAQLSLEEKRKVADWVIDNSGSFDHTFAQVRQFWRSLDLSPPN